MKIFRSVLEILILVCIAFFMGRIIWFFISGNAHAMTRRALPVEQPSPSPQIITPGKTFVYAVESELGPSVKVDFAVRALKLMNTAFENRCLEAGIKAHRFLSLNSVLTPGVGTSDDASKEYLGGAPYALALRWYYKAWPTKTIGYTYNYLNDDWESGKSETRIWSNTRFITNEKMYAAHLAHELSHQARAGGFVHYTVFSGSFPYDVGDIMAKCVAGF
jgi:hypothetical protein